MFCPFDRGFKCEDCPFMDYGKDTKTNRTHICSKLSLSLSMHPTKPAVFVENSAGSGCEDLSK